MSQEIVQAGSKGRRRSLVEKFANKFSIEPNKLMDILKATAFKQREGFPPPSNEQMAALLVVADQYNLNPFIKEIFAYPDKQNGIVPVVGVDGWSRIINQHPDFDGIEFRQFDNWVEAGELNGNKKCPEWMEAVIYRKDRSHPTVIREYLDEVYREPFKGKFGPVNGPWQSHTKRMLRHKTLIQGSRVAFAFTGIYDEDEAERIIEGQFSRVQQDAVGQTSQQAVGQDTPTTLDDLNSQLVSGVTSARAQEQQRRTDTAPADPPAAKAAEPAPTEDAADDQAGGFELTFDDVMSRINKARDADEIDSCFADATSVPMDADQQQQFEDAMESAHNRIAEPA